MKGLDFVSTRIGSRNERRFSNGNVYPIVAHPFGMAHFTVQNDGAAGSWFYDPTSHAFEGIRLTHQPSPWVGDYGHMLFLPFSGELSTPQLRWSSFRPEAAQIEPYRLEVYLQRYRVTARLAPAERGCILQIENGSGKQTGFAVLPYAASHFDIDGTTATGWTDSQSIWGFKRVREYFYMSFSRPIVSKQTVEHDGVAVWFDGDSVEIRIATSFVSVTQAERNYTRELNCSFACAEQAARDAWQTYLGRVHVSDENPARKRTFYSCLYRTLLYPRIFYEYGENGEPVHYNADTDTVERGVFYTDNGFWDTFRTVYPLFALIAPERYREICEGFINYAEETGWLPKWLSPGELGMMPGVLAEAVLADAAVKGILDKDLTARAYRYMRRSAFDRSDNPRHGRRGVLEYRKYGYVPDDIAESVNHTCDSAYGDFCVAQAARLVGDGETAKTLLASSKNYANLFDRETGFFRGRNRDGAFKPHFDPLDWGGDYCEGGCWQNGFGVYHDIDGLAALYGGKQALISKLDTLFATQPLFNVGGYGFEIHEMSEMASVDFGQCAISNQPSFHIPWLYTLLGAREKTEYWVEKLANEAFSAADDGFPGDEDNGTMAAWYVFACLGLYPVCPGKDEYVTAKPLFATIEINGRKVERFTSATVGSAQIVGPVKTKQ